MTEIETNNNNSKNITFGFNYFNSDEHKLYIRPFLVLLYS